jgi:hypothetical protein
MKILICLLFISVNLMSQNKPFTSFADADRFLRRSLTYTDHAIDSNFTGIVLCQFTVNKSGNVRNAAVLICESRLLNEIVLKAVNASDGKWAFSVPAQDSVTIILPVYFMISTPEALINRIPKEQINTDHPFFEAIKQEMFYQNVIFMKPVVCYAIVCIDHVGF